MHALPSLSAHSYHGEGDGGTQGPRPKEQDAKKTVVIRQGVPRKTTNNAYKKTSKTIQITGVRGDLSSTTSA